MASESTAHSAFGLMGYWLRTHSGSRNNYWIVDTAAAPALYIVGQ